MTDFAVLLLAAGSSTRMQGRDKLLEKVDGETILRRQAKAALGSGAHVIVALAPNRPKRTEALAGLPVQQVIVENAEEGMGVSIRTAVAELSPEIESVAMLPADMPEITAEDLDEVFAACAEFPSQIVRGASKSGVPGHPVVFPSRLFPMLARLTGDEGGRSILKQETVHLVTLPDSHALTDLDTPNEWIAWQINRLSNDRSGQPRQIEGSIFG